MTANTGQQVYDFWQKQLHQGTQTWMRTMGLVNGADDGGNANPFSAVSGASLFSGMGNAPLLSGALAQWRKATDQCIQSWSQLFERSMGTESFSKMMGWQTETLLAIANPIKKTIEQQTEQVVTQMGLPTRQHVIGLARQIIQLEEKLEAVEDQLAEVLKKLDNKSSAPTPRKRR